MADSDPVIFVVDDDLSVRRAMERLLRAEGFRVEAFESADQYLESGKAGLAECLLVDVQMPGLNGLELQERLASESVEVPIVFLTGHPDTALSVRAMNEGAIDFLEKPVDDTKLLATVRKALQVGAEVRERTAELRCIRERAETLTPHERDVMGLVVIGMLNAQIAYDLGASEMTIKAHRARVMEKMHVSSVADLIRHVDRLVEAERCSSHSAAHR